MFKHYHGVSVYDETTKLVLGICSIHIIDYNLICLKVSSFLDDFILQHIKVDPEYTCKNPLEEGEELDLSNDFAKLGKKHKKRWPSMLSKWKPGSGSKKHPK